MSSPCFFLLLSASGDDGELGSRTMNCFAKQIERQNVGHFMTAMLSMRRQKISAQKGDEDEMAKKNRIFLRRQYAYYG